MIEASAYIQFVTQGGTEAQWLDLTGAQSSDLVVLEGTAQFLLNSAWSVDDFMPAFFPSREAPDWEHMPPILASFLRLCAADDLPDADWLIHAEIKRLLLGPYGPIAPSFGQRCHIGHVVHGLWALAERYANPDCPITNDIQIFDMTDSVQQLEMKMLQPSPEIVLGVVSTGSHFALAVVTAGRAQRVVVYDGKNNDQVLEKTKKWRDQELNSEYDVVFASVPSQLDDWSCGHRILVHADVVLCHMLSDESPEAPLILSEDVVNDESIKEMCENLSVEKIKCEPKIKRESAPSKREFNTMQPPQLANVKMEPSQTTEPASEDPAAKRRRCEPEPLQPSESEPLQPSECPRTPPARARASPERGDSPQKPAET